MAKYEAGFIGAGNMGGALALAAAKKTGGDRIAVACSTRERSEAAAQRLGCTAETPQRILSDSRFVFLGVKPQMVVGVVEGLKADILASEGIFVSMLAGVSLEKLALLLGADGEKVRGVERDAQHEHHARDGDGRRAECALAAQTGDGDADRREGGQKYEGERQKLHHSVTALPITSSSHCGNRPSSSPAAARITIGTVICQPASRTESAAGGIAVRRGKYALMTT